jgi:hypothetical protein
METQKSWMQSKTIWLNVVALTLGAMPEIMSLIDVNVLTAIGVNEPVKYYTIIGLITGFLNIVLRGQNKSKIKPIRKKKSKLPKDEQFY